MRKYSVVLLLYFPVSWIKNTMKSGVRVCNEYILFVIYFINSLRISLYTHKTVDLKNSYNIYLIYFFRRLKIFHGNMF